MDEVMAATLPEGAAMDAHRAQLVTHQLVSEARLILTMEQRHRLWVVDEFPEAIPRTFTLGQFAATLKSAPEGLSLDELLTWTYRNRAAPASRTDVSDPYRQGPQKAARTADLLEDLISQVAQALVPSRQVA